MGLKGFNAFMKKKVPEAFTSTSVDPLCGSRCAVDAALYMNKYAYSAHNSLLYELASPVDLIDPDEMSVRLKNGFLSFIVSLLLKGITPIVVFDGPSYSEKAICQGKRCEARDKLNKSAEDKISEYKNKNVMLIDSNDDRSVLKSRSNLYKIRPSDYEMIFETFTALGIPCVKAPHDAEKMCSSLYLEGFILAAFTNDSDSIPLGTGTMITDFNSSSVATVVIHEPIIRFIETEFQTSSRQEALFLLTEFSIMCGCDFNENIPKVGPANAIKLLKKHRNIENVGTERDISCLNHLFCREFFAHEPSGFDKTDLVFDKNLFMRNLNSFCACDRLLAMSRMINFSILHSV